MVQSGDTRNKQSKQIDYIISSKNNFNILHILELNWKIISSRVQSKYKKIIIQNALYKVDAPDSCINHVIYRTNVYFPFVNRKFFILRK